MDFQTINLAGIAVDSIVDGPGIRTVFFAQGCSHKCKGCHNPNTHSFKIVEECKASKLYSIAKKNPLATGITFSGGEPFDQAEGFLALAKLLKSDNYEIAAYTGYTFEELTIDAQKELLKYIDILIDGKYILEKRNLDLRFRGSENQRIIDVVQSLKTGTVVLSAQERWIGDN